jgi:hypothetical protein
MILNQQEAQRAWFRLQASMAGGASRAATAIFTSMGTADVSTFVRSGDAVGAAPVVLVMYTHVNAPYDTPKPELYQSVPEFKRAYGI